MAKADKTRQSHGHTVKTSLLHGKAEKNHEPQGQCS